MEEEKPEYSFHLSRMIFKTCPLLSSIPAPSPSLDTLLETTVFNAYDTILFSNILGMCVYVVCLYRCTCLSVHICVEGTGQPSVLSSGILSTSFEVESLAG